MDKKVLQEAIAIQVDRHKKREMLFEAVGVSWGTAVAIQDAAKGAGITQIHYLKRPPKEKEPPK